MNIALVNALVPADATALVHADADACAMGHLSSGMEWRLRGAAHPRGVGGG